jgi:hypothetical protein
MNEIIGQIREEEQEEDVKMKAIHGRRQTSIVLNDQGRRMTAE